jgi:hypothetical protein
MPGYFETFEGSTEVLMKGWQEGCTGTQIADVLFETYGIRPTRNQIMGKVNRLVHRGLLEYKTSNGKALPRAARGPRPPRPPRLLRTAGTSPKIEPTTKPLPEAATIPRPRGETNVVFINARSGQCRFFVNGESGILGHVCGAKVYAGKAWCPEHMTLVYQPADRRENTVVSKITLGNGQRQYRAIKVA